MWRAFMTCFRAENAISGMALFMINANKELTLRNPYGELMLDGIGLDEIDQQQ